MDEKRTEERTETYACDCISRQAAIDAIDKEYRCTDHSDDWDGLKTAMLIIENLPSAQPERKTGRWVSVGCVVPNIANVPMIKCTVCGHLEPDVEAARTPYCSHCGAYMGGDTDETD